MRTHTHTHTDVRTHTLLVHPGGLDQLSSPQLGPHQRHVDVPRGEGGRGLGGAGAGQGPGELGRQLGQDAADVPLLGLPESVHEDVLGEKHTSTQVRYSRHSLQYTALLCEAHTAYYSPKQ